MTQAAPRQLTFGVPSASGTDAARLLRETPVAEQPRTRMEELGPAALSLTELFQVALDCPNDPLLPLRLLNRWDSLLALEHASAREMRRIQGMTPARVARLQAMLELARRAQATQPQRTRIHRAADLAALLMPEMSGLDHEQMRVVLLSTKNDVLGVHLIYQGSVHTTVIRAAEIFAEAVRANAPSIAIAHNHPSSDPSPSPEDLRTNKSLVEAGKTLDIELLDHLVIGANRFFSFKEHGVGF